MENYLNFYQVEAVDKIVSAYDNRKGKCCINMPVGSGINVMLLSAINKLFENDSSIKIMILFSRVELTKQFGSSFLTKFNDYSFTNSAKDYSGQNLLCTTYNKYILNLDKLNSFKFDVIICQDAEHVNSEKYVSLLNHESDLLLGVFNHNNMDPNNLFVNSNVIFETNNIANVFNERILLNALIVPMLASMGYKDIELDKQISQEIHFCPDIVACKDNINYIIELKSYKGPYIDRKVLWNAINQVNKYRQYFKDISKNRQYGIILLCIVDEKLKQEIIDEYGILIWDIKNLLYICSENKELAEKLEHMIPYSLNGIELAAPIELVNYNYSEIKIENNEYYEDELLDKLKNCKPGKTKRAHIEYEKICSSIISYLFKSEFSQFSEQHTTDDEMFRMDIICALKGTTAFWDFLIRYYNTKFVVFECKNYKEKLKQNLIYVTDKYLFNPALRNVAFIISRSGFSDNAQKSAIGILKEQGKLIVDLTDEDLEIMICIKRNGQEPSDYLLDKIEKLLMGVSI